MTVTIYSTPTCGFCNQAKAFFQANSIEYTEKDVNADEADAKEMVDKSGQMSVPVILVEKKGKEEMVIGFNESKLKELLNL